MPRFFRSIIRTVIGFLLFSSCLFSNPKNVEETSIWIVRTIDGVSEELLNQGSCTNLGELKSLDGFYKLDFSKSNLDNESIKKLLTEAEEVLWFEHQKKDQISKVGIIPGDPVTDPLFGSAWHITNSGASDGRKGADLNLVPTWDYGVDGTGVIVAVIDEGTELTHPDLSANIRTDLALDLIGSGSGAHQLDSDENHGTAVSGIIGAVDNEIGSVGVAYGAQLVPIRYLGESHSDYQSAEVMGYQRNLIAVYNNSWGPSLGEDANGEDIPPGYMLAPGNLGESSIIQGTTNGRRGLGNIYVFAAGNDGVEGANVNYNGWANMRQTIAVGAIGNKGTHADYSEPGAPLLVTAPSGGQSRGIITTDRTGSVGYDVSDYTETFSGTSAAAPMVSGLVALMLDANPQLNWRDVQHILAKTAIQIDPSHESWKINGAGLPFSDIYGFGKVDASAAVQMSVNWPSVSEEKSTSVTRSVNRTIPNLSDTGYSSTINITRELKVEHVYVTARFSHSDWGDLEIILTSPAGTESVLASPHDDYTGTYSSWTYTSVQFLDEISTGQWTLTVKDKGNEGSGSFSNWALQIFGTDVNDRGNKAPSAQADEYLGTDYPIAIPVLANDFDSDGDPMTIFSLYSPEEGTLNITDNQELLYTPSEDFLGVDHFGYSITDGKGGVSDTFVDVVHPGPVPMTDQAVAAMNQSVSIPVLANDFDRSGDEVALVSVDAAVNGFTTIDGENIIYTPSEGFVGFEELKYTITDNNDGERSGKIRTFTSAAADFAVLFDGKDDVAKVAASNALNITQSITVEASFYLRSYGEYGEVGFGRIADRDTYNLFVNGESHQNYADHSLVFALELPGANGSVFAAANSPKGSIKLNRWHTVSVSYDGYSIRMYIDGKEVAVTYPYEAVGGNLVSNPEAELYMGENPAGLRALDGMIDWVRIWNVARKKSEQATATVFVDEDDRDGLIGWWQFLEGTGYEAKDLIGGHHADLYDVKWVPTDPTLLSKALER